MVALSHTGDKISIKESITKSTEKVKKEKETESSKLAHSQLEFARGGGTANIYCSDPKHREPNLQLRPHCIIQSQLTFSISAKSSHIWTSPYVIPVITPYRSFLCFCLSHMSIPPTQPTTFFLYLFNTLYVMICQLNVCIYVCKIILNNQSVDQNLNSTSSISGSVFSAH